jgi:hypothetical protein
MSLAPFVWTCDGDGEFVKSRVYMVSPAVAANLFSTMRIMERGVTHEQPRGVFSYGEECLRTTTLVADTIFGLLRSFTCEQVV